MLDHDGCVKGYLTASGFVEVHIDALQLQIRVSMVCTSGINAMLVTDNLQWCKLLQTGHSSQGHCTYESKMMDR